MAPPILNLGKIWCLLVRARRATGSKFHTEDAQILDVTVQYSVATRTCALHLRAYTIYTYTGYMYKTFTNLAPHQIERFLQSTMYSANRFAYFSTFCSNVTTELQ